MWISHNATNASFSSLSILIVFIVTHFKPVFGHCLCNNKMARDRHTPTEIEIVHRKKFDVYGENIYLHD